MSLNSMTERGARTRLEYCCQKKDGKERAPGDAILIEDGAMGNSGGGGGVTRECGPTGRGREKVQDRPDYRFG